MNILILIGFIYLMIGLVFSIPFAFKWVNKVDKAAVEGTLGFRLLIIPGTIAFWPWMMRKWNKARKRTSS